MSDSRPHIVTRGSSFPGWEGRESNREWGYGPVKIFDIDVQLGLKGTLISISLFKPLNLTIFPQLFSKLWFTQRLVSRSK